MKTNPFFLKGIHKRKLKVTCSPKRLAENEAIEKKEREDRLVKQDAELAILRQQAHDYMRDENLYRCPKCKKAVKVKNTGDHICQK